MAGLLACRAENQRGTRLLLLVLPLGLLHLLADLRKVDGLILLRAACWLVRVHIHGIHELDLPVPFFQVGGPFLVGLVRVASLGPYRAFCQILEAGRLLAFVVDGQVIELLVQVRV